MSSMSRKKQQTITQMEPFYDLYHPDQDEGLAYDGVPDDAEQESPPKKKRRKTMPVRQENSLTQMDYVTSSLQATSEPDVMQKMNLNCAPEPLPESNNRRRTIPSGPTHTVQPRSFRTQAVQKNIKHEHDTADNAGKSTVEKSKMTQTEIKAALMPPPKTPKSTRLKEIPSSQSPAVTPLSTQSRRSQREQSRSPLKEKSTNLPTHCRYPRKTSGQAPGLVGADSMNGTSIDSSTSARAELERKPTPTAFARLATLATTSQEGFAIGERDPTSVPIDQRDLIAHNPEKEAGITNSEIMDSNDEGSEDDLTDSGCDVDTEPQQGHTTMDLAILDKPVKFTVNNRGYQAHFQRLGHSAIPAASNLDTESEMPNYFSTQQSQASDKARSHEPQHPRSDSEEASAQLTAEFLRTTQPAPLVETDSQWEATWHTYSGPNNPTYNEDTKINFSSSPASGNLHALITPGLPRSQPPPPNSSSPTPVDITQPSPQLPSSFQRPSHNLPTLSSPPPPEPIFSSSPLPTRKDGEAYMGYMGGWNGERLTDSQLLPESLMDDSMPGPPGLLFMEEREGESG